MVYIFSTHPPGLYYLAEAGAFLSLNVGLFYLNRNFLFKNQVEQLSIDADSSIIIKLQNEKQITSKRGDLSFKKVSDRVISVKHNKEEFAIEISSNKNHIFNEYLYALANNQQIVFN